MAHQLARRGHEVVLWAREPEVAEGINAEHRNPLFISDLELHSGIVAVDDLDAAADHADHWLWVVPVQFSRSVMEELAAKVRDDVVLISASKGIETETLAEYRHIGGYGLRIGLIRHPTGYNASQFLLDGSSVTHGNNLAL